MSEYATRLLWLTCLLLTLCKCQQLCQSIFARCNMSYNNDLREIACVTNEGAPGR